MSRDPAASLSLKLTRRLLMIREQESHPCP